jgi:hypothetical protein
MRPTSPARLFPWMAELGPRSCRKAEKGFSHAGNYWRTSVGVAGLVDVTIFRICSAPAMIFLPSA